jgi:predicted nucleic acid-binding protein
VIVVDASALIEVLLNTPAAASVASRIFAADESLHVPHVLDLEVAQALRRFVRSRNMPAHRAQQALDDLADMPLMRYPHDPLLPRIWALRDNLTAYDAAYLALAEILGATLVTRDVALSSVKGHSARVEVVF